MSAIIDESTICVSCGHKKRLHFGFDSCYDWSGWSGATPSPDCRCDGFKAPDGMTADPKEINQEMIQMPKFTYPK